MRALAYEQVGPSEALCVLKVIAGALFRELAVKAGYGAHVTDSIVVGLVSAELNFWLVVCVQVKFHVFEVAQQLLLPHILFVALLNLPVLRENSLIL